MQQMKQDLIQMHRMVCFQHYLATVGYLQTLAYLLSPHSYSKEEEVLNPMFCPPFTIGYALDRKVWCRFFIDQLQPIEWRPNPMDELILPQQQKKVLQALVGSHRFPEQSRDEWVTKGQGLIVLLHGSPGSGKTLTAECAAENNKKALLKISLAELRDDDRLEQNMIRFQRYASTWKAIVLIDEADVFLEARTSEGKDSADRNALVAVFLRTLEYFQGIIFLTSNRVSVFDQAIKSRIHLALQYSPPDDSARQRLWYNALSALPAGTTDFDLSLDITAHMLAEAEMNGREISNSIHTALTLARDEKKKLGREHLDTIISVWTAFAKTLDGEHGMKNRSYTL
jgi:AAA+ superfamily predicted ATPase